jgi:hypothetical protein
LGEIKIGGDDDSTLQLCGFDDMVVFGLVQADGGHMISVVTILSEPDREQRRKGHVNEELHANSMISSSANAAA